MKKFRREILKSDIEGNRNEKTSIDIFHCFDFVRLGSSRSDDKRFRSRQSGD
jgi:hypothetical protein